MGGLHKTYLEEFVYSLDIYAKRNSDFTRPRRANKSSGNERYKQSTSFSGRKL